MKILVIYHYLRWKWEPKGYNYVCIRYVLYFTSRSTGNFKYKSLKVSKRHRRVSNQEVILTYCYVDERKNFHPRKWVMLCLTTQNDIRPVLLSLLSKQKILCIFHFDAAGFRSSRQRALCWAAHSWSGNASLSLNQPNWKSRVCSLNFLWLSCLNCLYASVAFSDVTSIARCTQRRESNPPNTWSGYYIVNNGPSSFTSCLGSWLERQRNLIIPCLLVRMREQMLISNL